MKCSICGREYSGCGNNAQPINDGRCCNECDRLVIARRLRDAGLGDAVADVLRTMDELAAKVRQA